MDYRAIADHRPCPAPARGLVPSAVLVPLWAHPEGDRLLFTRRSETVGSHRGQVCFPGGKRSEGDADAWQTALREAWEEIGLVPADVTPIGQLDDLETVTGFTITPVVGRLPWPYEFAPNPGEIDRIVSVPVADLLVPGVIRSEIRRLPTGRRVHLFFFDAEDLLVWGATARITRQLVALLHGEPPELVPEILPDR